MRTGIKGWNSVHGQGGQDESEINYVHSRHHLTLLKGRTIAQLVREGHYGIHDHCVGDRRYPILDANREIEIEVELLDLSVLLQQSAVIGDALKFISDHHMRPAQVDHLLQFGIIDRQKPRPIQFGAEIIALGTVRYGLTHQRTVVVAIGNDNSAKRGNTGGTFSQVVEVSLKRPLGKSLIAVVSKCNFM